jgi:RNase H-fold protein (predicted Holliday junction resolvase)
MLYLGFDPGKDKCGVAVVDDRGQPQWWQVIAAAEVVAQLPEVIDRWAVGQVVMGDRTMARQWQARLQPLGLPVALVDEHNSTLEARDRYWQMYPAQGLQRLIPQGMRLPPRPIDDIVAIILVQRYLAGKPQL